MIAKMRCFFSGHHVPVRHPLGGFRCATCGKPAADLHDLGYDGYVSLMRTLFSREPFAETTRTSSWEPPRSRPVPFPSRTAATEMREMSRSSRSAEALAKGA
jgi:hypothetical protein